MAKLPAQFRFITRIRFPEVYFLSVDNADPSPTFLARFHNNKPPVKARSAVKPRRFEVVDKVTEKEGILLSANTVRWITVSQAKVETGWHKDGRGGTFGTCLVEKQKSGWVVLYYAIRGVS
ncbi:hypothetical protein HNQ39_002664 [Armatimonas rosea]|uniref:Uncharacterized protein n=2 Tax=Armatimonas rosea TaxID=685828 RepID=A0A7W9SRF2_ARMRO|nr:hypothetical protein [Armatimonas rosea]